MAHLSDGTLRRLYDEPFAIPDPERAHYASCPACQTRFQELADGARSAQAALAVPAATVDAAAALARIRPALGAPRPRVLRLRGRAWLPRAAALAAAAALTAVLVGSGVAQDAVQVFQPQQIQLVPIASGDLVGLPDLSQFGNLKPGQAPELKEADSAAAAAASSGLPLISVNAASLPKSVDVTHVQYGTVGQVTGTFTFSAAKAQAYYASQGKTLPAMPMGMDGSTLEVTGGPAEAVIYGEIGRGGEGQKPQFPTLAIGATKAPVVTSTGVTVPQLKSYLKELAPQLAASIDAVGDSSSTLPIPVPVDKVDQRSVTVNGVQGVALGDNTGFGSAVIWESHGVIWAVGGTITQDQALAIANSLHT